MYVCIYISYYIKHKSRDLDNGTPVMQSWSGLNTLNQLKHIQAQPGLARPKSLKFNGC